jgi:ABC-type glycerol-3-phosphate transport system substrate-binding protein
MVVVPQANGAKLVSDDGKKAQLDSPEVLEAVEWAKGHLKRLGSFDSINTWRTTLPGGPTTQPGTAVGAADMFAHKKMMAVIGGNWFADNIRRINKTLKFAAAPIPSGPRGPRDAKTNVFSGGILEAARKGGPKLDLMWDFMKYTASKEGGYYVQLNTADVCASREGARDPRIIDSPETGLGRKEFLPFFDTGVGLHTIKHPAAADINTEYNKPLNAYLRDQIANLRDELREANRLAQQKIDEFFQQNPGAQS